MNNAMKKVLLAAAVPVLLSTARNSRAGDWETIDGANSAVARPEVVAVTDAKSWAELWARHCKGGPQAMAMPGVDFSKETVIAVFLGNRPTGGYKIDLTVVQDPLDSSKLFVLYREIAPKPGAMVSQMVSRPFVIRKIKKAYASVTFEPNRKVEAYQGSFTTQAHEKLEGIVSRLQAVAEKGIQ